MVWVSGSSKEKVLSRLDIITELQKDLTILAIQFLAVVSLRDVAAQDLLRAPKAAFFN